MPLTNIKRVTRIGIPGAVIETTDSSSFIVSFNSWNRGKFIRVMRNTNSLIIGGARDRAKKAYIKCVNDSAKVSLRLNAYGSLGYTPLNIHGCFYRQNDQLIFTPSEFTNYVDTVRIKMADIESIRQKGGKKVCIKMLSGQKFKFKADDAALLLHYLKIK